jgi:hypothetical protein
MVPWPYSFRGPSEGRQLPSEGFAFACLRFRQQFGIHMPLARQARGQPRFTARKRLARFGVIVFELFDQALEISSHFRQRFGRRLTVGRAARRGLGGLRHRENVIGDFRTTPRRFRHVPARLVGRDGLVLHRARDGVLKVADLVDDCVDLFNRIDRAGGRRLSGGAPHIWVSVDS